MFNKLVIVAQLLDYDDLVIKYAESLSVLGFKEYIIVKNMIAKTDRKIEVAEGTRIYEAAKKLNKNNIKTEIVEVNDIPIKEINYLAEKGDKDSLILVGGTSSSLAKRIFEQDFAYNLIQNPSKPILVMRVKEGEDESLYSIPRDGFDFNSKILYATDFSANSYNAFDYIKKLVEKGAKNITLMHVQDVSVISPYLDYKLPEFNKIDSKRLYKMKENLENIGDVNVDIVLDIGRPFKIITNYISKNKVKLVVMGRQGKGFLSDLFIGSTSNNVAMRADTSVLLIPKKDR